MSGRHYRALSMMHQQVQRELDNEGKSPQPDWVRIGQLKRLRLSIKDRMRSILEEGRTPQRAGSVRSALKRQSQTTSISSLA